MHFTVIKVKETRIIKTDQVILEIYVSKVSTVNLHGKDMPIIKHFNVTDLLIYPKTEFNLRHFVSLNKTQDIFEVDLNTFNVRIEPIEGVGVKEVYFHSTVEL